MLEYLAAALALLYLLLAIKESWLCWPAAIISSLLYFKVFFEVQLYMESLLQLFYAGMAFYGWYKWRPSPASSLLISSWSAWHHLLFSLLAVGSALPVAYILARHSDASFPWLDTLLTAFSILATYMVALKILENWIYWIVIDAISLLLYAYKNLYISSALFLLYTILAIFGYQRWKRIYLEGRV